MKISTVFVIAILILTAIFAFINWTTFNTATELSLGFTTVQLPLGVVMLSLMILIAVAFLVYLAFLQSSVLLQTRRHNKELHANRELADQAEASRFTALQALIQAELAKLATQNLDAKNEVLAKGDRIAQDLNAAIETSGNTLAAYIGEVEDRLEKK